MCGIAFALLPPGRSEPPEAWVAACSACDRRGPDVSCTVVERVRLSSGEDVRVLFHGAVLGMRQEQVVQPLRSANGDILLWNGEVFGGSLEIPSGRNDGAMLMEALGEVSSQSHGKEEGSAGIIRLLGGIQGPYAVVYYEKRAGRIWFGRDCLGRRSLLDLGGGAEDGRHDLPLCLSSVSQPRWEGEDRVVEVEAGRGLYQVDMNEMRHGAEGWSVPVGLIEFPEHIAMVRKDVPREEDLPAETLLEEALDGAAGWERGLEGYAEDMDRLYAVLEDAVRIRLSNLHPSKKQGDSRVGILFSGGVDCAILAAIADRILEADEPIDLMNVAFENPRTCKAGATAKDTWAVPDRVTGLAALVELRTLSPGREWRWVEVNVPYAEAMEGTERVRQLMYPATTRMDLSIALAFSFAARGRGILREGDGEGREYETAARVLLLGSGADEQFGGYSRHRDAYVRGGWEQLVEEIQLDVSRISSRNFGRDDRILADWGRESRLPYVDERVMGCVGALGVERKMDMRLGRGRGEKILLRLLARHRLGFGEGVSQAPKRAIQFGARSAKMEGRWERGDDALPVVRQP